MWEAIATRDGIQRWFAPFASVEEGEGGTVSVAWVEGADWPTRITVWQPGERLQMVDLSDPEAAAQGTALTVDYQLSTADGKTRVRLVNSGLPATPGLRRTLSHDDEWVALLPMEPEALCGTAPRCRAAR